MSVPWGVVWKGCGVEGAWRGVAWPARGCGKAWRGRGIDGNGRGGVWHQGASQACGVGVASAWLCGRGVGAVGHSVKGAWWEGVAGCGTQGRGNGRGRGMARPAHLLLELHADGVGLLEEDGVAPQQVPQRRELVPLPLPEGPQCQLALPLCPLDCAERRARSMRGGGSGPPGSHQLSGVFGKGSDRETCLRERPLGPTAAAAPPA